MIDEQRFTTDTLLLHGYLPSEVQLSNRGNDLIVRFNGTSDELILARALSGSTNANEYGVDQIVFDNGTTWSRTTLRAQLAAQAPIAGNDTITGTASADTLAGGTGDDYLTGLGGNDTYVFARGDGRDAIRDNGFSSADRIRIQGYLPSELVLQKNGADLIIRFAGTTDVLTVLNTLDGASADQIEEIAFDNGTVWTAAEIRSRAVATQVTSGSDTIEGTSFTDTLAGGLGDDYLTGADGSDTYVFARGDGRDAVRDNGFADIDRIQIQGYLPTELSLQKISTDLIIRFAGTTDVLTIFNTLDGDAYDQIEEIAFDNGTVWAAAEIRSRAVATQVSSGSDTIEGTANAETLAGGLGNDYLTGLGGDDTYIFARGDGRDAIRDGGYSGADRLRIQGYLPSELVLQKNGADLIIRFAGTTDILTVFSTLDGPGADQIEEITFDNGTVWTLAEIRSRAVATQVSSASDTIEGTANAETLAGGLGDDYLTGLGGSDTYIFARGDGRDVIRDIGAADTDRIQIQGYLPAELILQRNGADLIIRFVGTNDKLTVLNTLAGDYYDQIEQIAFDNGTVWLAAEIATRSTAVATAGNDYIQGLANVADTLAGGRGDDTLSGLSGSDTYVFNRGDGRDIVDDNGASNTDQIVIHGYLPGEAILERDGTTLFISFVGTSDQITVVNTLEGDSADGIEQVVFDNGTIWTAADFRARVLAAQNNAGNGAIEGFNISNDLLNGGLGNDWLSGKAGDDTYVYTRGGGHDIISDLGSGADKVLIQGYLPGEVSVRQVGSDLIFRFASDAGSLTITSGLANDTASTIEQFVFDNGTTWTIADVGQRLIENAQTSGDDILNGTATANRLSGGRGDDIISGLDGADTYVFARGDGRDTIKDNGAGGTDTIEISGYAASELFFQRIGAGGSDFVIRFQGTSDSITVVNGLAGSAGDTIERIVLAATGEIITFAQITDRVLVETATPGSDLVIGTTGSDILTGVGGSDLLDGGQGDDLYIYHAGDGDDRILDTGSSANDIVRIEGYSTADILTIKRSPPDGADLVLTFKGVGDRLLIADTLDSGSTGVEKIVFANGTEWTLSLLRQLVVDGAGTAANEQIWGFDGSDTINGRAGSDWLSGGLGGDSYIYGKGNGADTIEDNGSAAGTDTVVITGYASTDATVSRFYKGDDGILIRFAGSSEDSLIILNTLSGDAAGTIEDIVFSDGVHWSPAFILDLLQNSKPVAQDDGLYSVVRGLSSVIEAASLLQNDFDADKDTLRITAVSNAQHGSVTLDARGNVIFTADPDFVGLTSFDYTVSDGHNGLDTATVQVRIRPPASATDDTGLTVAEDGFLSIPAEQLLSNDFDGDLLVIAQVLNAVHGTVSLSSAGSITFVPTADYNGPASFRYVANTRDGGRAEANVFIDVTPVNDAPAARNDTGFSVIEGGVLRIRTDDLLRNDTDADGDRLTVTSVGASASATVSLSSNGYVTITPQAFFFGTTSFTYLVSDGQGGTATATAMIDVVPVNDAPEPVTDLLTTSEDTVLLIAASTLTQNDIEHDPGDQLVVTRVFSGASVTPTLLANGTILIETASNFYGQAFFTYEVSDGHGGLAIGRANVQVNPVNDAPIAFNESYNDNGVNFLRGMQNQPLVISVANLFSNDRDIDSASFTLSTVSLATNGTVEIRPEGVVFTPDPGYWGEASFRYVIEDRDHAVDDALVTLYFDPILHAPPLPGKDALTGYEDVEIVVPVSVLLANDRDVDDNPLRIVSVSASTRFGTAWLEGNFVHFKGSLNFNGNGWFNYVVTDDTDGTAEGRVDVTLLAVNDAPTAALDRASTSLDAPLVVRISDLLLNDSDVDVRLTDYSTILSFVSASAPTNGVLSIYDNEFIVVEQTAGFSGPLSFTYTIKDDQNATDDGRVAAVVSSIHAETIYGSDRRDLLIGTSVGERFEGGAGDDDLFGRGGNDYFASNDGADKIDGGDGIDTVSFTTSNIGIRVDLQSRIGQGGYAQGDVYTDIENVEGSRYADQLLGNQSDNQIDGGAGADELTGRVGNDQLFGGADDDILAGNEGADLLDGGSGSDTADYSDSAAGVSISLQAQTATGGDAAGDTLVSVENLIGTSADDVLEGDAGNNRLAGGRGNDTLRGLDGNDILIGGRGADVLDGGAGIDIADYSGSSEAVVIDMSGVTAGGGDAAGDVFSSIEIVYGSYHDDTIIGDSSDNIIRGGAGADIIDGGSGFDTADYSNAASGVTVNLGTGVGSQGDASGDQLANIEKLIGSSYNDALTGGASDDTFDGGFGDDTLAGGAGSDTYLFGFDSTNDTIIEGVETGIDRVVLASDVRVRDVSLVRQGGDLLIELENDDGFLIDTLTVRNQFLAGGMGIEEIVFAGGQTWDRADIDVFLRNTRFNAAGDLVRWANEDEPYVISSYLLTENDTSDGAPGLTIVSVENFVNGTARLLADGSIEFVGAKDFNGSAFFDYTVTDGLGRLSSATAEVLVRPINDAPFAANDGVFYGQEDTILFIPYSALYANDGDIDGDALSISVDGFGPLLDAHGAALYVSAAGNASNGDASIRSDGVYFQPAPDHYGVAGFRYTLLDGHGGTASAQVELYFAGVNDAPRPRDDRGTTRAGQTISFSTDGLVGNDIDIEGDPLTFVRLGAVEHGTVTIGLVPDASGELVHSAIFIPDAGFVGVAGFDYVVRDDHNAEATGHVNVRVKPLNDPPVARNDYGFQALENSVLVIDPAVLLANDYDPNGDTLSLDHLDLYPEKGEVRLRADGKIEFTPKANYNGQASFEYWINDGEGGIAKARVFLYFNPLNNTPAVNDDVVDVYEDLPAYLSAFEAFANDQDPEGDVIYFDSFEVLGVLTNDFVHRRYVETSYDPDFGVRGFAEPAGTTASATLTDGTALPPWLHFDAATWTLTGAPPSGLTGDIQVRVNLQHINALSGDIARAERVVTITIPAGENPSLITRDLNPDDFKTSQDAVVTARLADQPLANPQAPGSQQLPAWLTFDPQTATFHGQRPAGDTSEIRILVASSERNGLGFSTYEFVIDGYDRDFGVRTFAPAEGALVTAALADGSALPSWLTFDAATITLSGTPPLGFTGLVNVRLSLSHPAGTDGGVVTTTRNIVIDPSQVGPGGNVTRDLELKDFEVASNATVSAKLANGDVLPSWLTIDPATWTLHGTPPDKYVGRLNVVVTALQPDGHGTSTYAFELVVDPAVELDFGKINTDYTARAPFVHTLTATELDAPAGAELAATLVSGDSLPAWLFFDAATRTFNGTAPDHFIGDIKVDVTATTADAVTGQPDVSHTIIDLLVDRPARLSSGGVFLSQSGDDIRIRTVQDFNGSVAIQYKARDLKGAVSENYALAVINVLPQRELPDARNDSFQTLEDSTLSLTFNLLLANDFDKDGDAVRFVSLTGAAHGTVTLETTPLTFNLPPAAVAGLTGAGITFSAQLESGGALPAWLAINPQTGTLSGVPPLDFGGSIAVRVVASDGVRTVSTTHAISGSVNDHYKIIYTPDAQFSGNDTFTYTITDDHEGFGTAVVAVDVLPVNDPPVAVADKIDAIEDTPKTFTTGELLANDTDVDHDVIQFVSFTAPGHGVLTRVGNTLTYTPDHNFSGTDTFNYTISDNDGTATGRAEIKVASTNKAPVTGLDYFSGYEDQPIIITREQLLANDTDPDGDTIQFVTIVQNVEHGRAFFRPDGSIALAPDADFNGTLSFVYQITDGRLTTPTNDELTLLVPTNASILARVYNIFATFAAVNDAPVLANDSGFAIDEDTTLAIGANLLLANDTDKEGDALTVIGVDNPINGTVTFINGVVQFTPRADYVGNAGFEYRVRDAGGAESTAFVAIDVKPVNDLPIAAPDRGFEIDEDTELVIDPSVLLANDIDLDHDPIVFKGVYNARLEADGKIHYFAGGDVYGHRAFTYTISDGNGPDVIGTVEVNIRPINDAPRPLDYSVGSFEDTIVTIPVLSLIGIPVDVDGQSVQLTAVSSAVGGTVEIRNGNVVFTPAKDFYGDASFAFTLTDTTGLSADARATITYAAVNDPAVLSSADISLTETNARLSTSGTLTITDVDNPALFVAQTNVAGSTGTFSINAAGAWTYTANSAFDSLNVGQSVSDTFTVAAVDGTTTTVRVTINGTNDAAVLSSAVIPLTETNAALSTSGVLSISDVDSPATFAAQLNTAGTYGVFSIDAAGAWTFTANSALDYLAAGQSVSDTFTVAAFDGTTSTVRVTINGTNDAAVLSSASVNLAETGAILSTGGSLTIFDPDSPALFTAQTNTVGVNGFFSINAAGAWTYTSNTAVAELGTGQSVSDTFTVASADGTTTTVKVTLTGANTAAILSSAVVNLTETNAALSTGGTLTITDVDNPALFVAQTNVAGSTGTFSITAAGAWTYAANAAFDSLNVGQSVSDPFTVAAVDGTTTTVRVTINGTNDAPVVSSAVSASAVEDGAIVTVNALANATDVDGGAVLIVTGLPATLPAGVTYNAAARTFSLNPADPAYQHLRAGVTEVVTVAYGVSDGIATTPASVSFTITGTNDAPIITSNGGTATAVTSAAENATAVTTVTATDADDGAVLTYAIVGGADASKFSINAATGVLSFITAPDFENPLDVGANNIYDVIVQVSDGTIARTQALAVTVTDVASETVVGTAGNDVIRGGVGNDTLSGLAGNDTIDGGVGDDLIDGGAGNDVLAGGVGIDTVSYASATAGVTVSLVPTTQQNTVGAGLDTLNGFENITGSAFADSLTGSNGDNVLDGGAGNDTLIGGLGNDTYIVDAAGDVVTEALNAGIDTLQTALASYSLAALTNVENLTGTASTGQTLSGNATANTIRGGVGHDTLDGLAGIDTLIGGLGDDIYVVDVAGDIVTELTGEGTDTIRTALATYSIASLATIENLTGTAATAQTLTGNAGVNTLTGGAGNDTLDGGAGADTLIGGAGNDIYIVDALGDVITELAAQGTDTIRTAVASYSIASLSNVENLTGTATTGGQTLTGNAGVNAIIGTAGNDTIDGGAGADTMTGGLGDDIYLVDAAADVVTEAASAGTDTIRTALAVFSLSAIANVENLLGTSATGQTLSGNALANRITGGAGNDTLDGGAGVDTLIGGLGDDTYVVDVATDVVTELAGEGTDTIRTALASYSLASLGTIENLTGTLATAQTLTGNNTANVITTGAGADTLDGGAGADTLVGGAGNDIYIVDNVGDVVTEAAGAGTDTIRTSLASYSIASLVNVENLTGTAATGQTLTGNANVNVITGGAGDDILDGGAGIDTLIGGVGNDIYIVDSTTDTITEAVNAGTDTVQSSVTFSLAALANIENLSLLGTAIINATGNAAANVIVGNSAANVINGGLGNDALTGGLGADTFVFNTTLGATNVDNITDFSVIDDTINLENTGAGLFTALATTGTLAANAFWTGSAAHLASDRIIYNAVTGDLLYDADGTGATLAVRFATLGSGLSLTNQDFVVI